MSDESSDDSDYVPDEEVEVEAAPAEEPSSRKRRRNGEQAEAEPSNPRIDDLWAEMNTEANLSTARRQTAASEGKLEDSKPAKKATKEKNLRKAERVLAEIFGKKDAAAIIGRVEASQSAVRAKALLPAAAAAAAVATNAVTANNGGSATAAILGENGALDAAASSGISGGTGSGGSNTSKGKCKGKGRAGGPPRTAPPSVALAATAAAAAAAVAAARKPQKVEVTETKKFAGREVALTRKVAEGSAEHKRLAAAAAAAATKPAAAIDRVLQQLDVPKAITTVEKSSVDWENFKEKEGLDEELAKVTKDGAGYLHRQDFLQRVDVRQFEKERDVRLASAKSAK